MSISTINGACGLAASLMLGSALAADGAAAPVKEIRVELGAGVDYSVGDYGEVDETTFVEVPLTGRIVWDRLSVRVRVPFVSVEGPGGVIPGEFNDEDNRGRDDDDDDDDNGEGGGTGGGGGAPVVAAPADAQGLGDVSIGAAYTLDLTSSVYLDLIGRVTLPTGDEEKDLGRGETDTTLGAEIGGDGDGGGVYAYGGWKLRGGDTREDGAEAAIGGYVRLGNGRSIGSELSWAESSRATGDDNMSASIFASQRLADGLRLSGYVETGLSDNAPSFGAGARITFRTDMRRPFQRQ